MTQELLWRPARRSGDCEFGAVAADCAHGWNEYRDSHRRCTGGRFPGVEGDLATTGPSGWDGCPRADSRILARPAYVDQRLPVGGNARSRWEIANPWARQRDGGRDRRNVERA